MNKPKFDPNQAFTTAPVDKPKFDPSAPFQTAALPPPQAMPVSDPSTSGITAATTGMLSGASGGFADEIGALGSTAMKGITGVAGPLAGGSLDDLVDDYRQTRDENRAAFAKAAAAHPAISAVANLAGGAATMGGMTAPTGVVGATAQGAAIGAVGGLGNSNADLTQGNVGQAAIDTAKGAALGGVTAGAMHAVVPAVVSAVGNKLGRVGSSLTDKAEALAVNATGATGNQASKFEAGAGRKLLDDGIVSFGDNQQDIAAKASDALSKSGQDISDSLSTLDQTAPPITRDQLLAQIQAKIDALKGSPSQAKTVRQLGSIVDDIKAGPENYSLNDAETEKRGFQKLVNWNTPESNPGNAEASDVFRNAVEDSATNADPAMADKFTAAKADYGTLAPIEEAAQKRASQQSQSQPFNFLEMGGIGAGAAAGASVAGPAGAVVGGATGYVAKKFIAPRLASSGAVAADNIGEVLQRAPEAFGKFAGVLQSAAARGSTALAAAHYMLQQTNPEYREKSKEALGQ